MHPLMIERNRAQADTAATWGWRRGSLIVVAVACLATSAVPSAAFAADAGDAALTVSKKAYNAYKAGDYKRAAIMYRAAWHTNPKMLTYLYNSARAAQLAGSLDDAERDYRLYIDKARRDSPEVAKAWHHLGEIGESKTAARKLAAKRKAAAGGKSHKRDRRRRVAPPPPPQPSKTDNSGLAVPGWILVVGGAGAVVGGAVFLSGASADQRNLDAKQQLKDANGKIVGITHLAAIAEQNRINSDLVFGYVLGGVGLVAVGAGAWLLVASSSRVSLAPGPTPRGLSLAWRF